MNLVYGDPRTTPWICGLLKMDMPKDSVSIGISKNGIMIGAALYHNYNLTYDGKPLFIEMSFGTIDNWATRSIINELLVYPFFQLRVKRVQSTVSKKNRKVRNFLDKLGFKLEGTGRLAWPHGGDACMYSLLSREFFKSKWNLTGDSHRKIGPLSSGSTGSVYYSSGTNGFQRANGCL